uniref:Uncharacterized protein n=1 Tax=Leersia perrieri TaxID=77586 RepID=A0A0D9VNZ1_9ORYZ
MRTVGVEEEEYTLLAITGSDFNEFIIIIDSPATRCLLLDTNRTYYEKTTESGGSLSVHIGDALSPSATIEGGFSDGRIMVNCGGADAAVSLADDAGPLSWVQNPTIKALCAAFPGQRVAVIIPRSEMMIDDTAMSGRDQVLSSSSRFAS